MESKKTDLVAAGGAVAYDAKTGEILRTHERVVEVEKGREYDRPEELDDAALEAIRKEAARVFPNREVQVVPLPAGAAHSGHVERSVDVASGTVVEREPGPSSLGAHFAEAD